MLMTSIDWGDTLRVANLVIAVLNLALVLMFVNYLRTLYHPTTRGQDVKRFTSARVGTIAFLIYGLLVLFASINGAHHALDTAPQLNFWARTVVFACQLAIFLILLAWHAMMLEGKYHGRWPRLDRLIDRLLHFSLV